MIAESLIFDCIIPSSDSTENSAFCSGGDQNM